MADTFDSREACQKWIDSRVIRFSYAFKKVGLPGIKTDAKTYVPDMWTTAFEKDGSIVLDPLSPSYKKQDGDEPLKDYARPVRQGRSWIAFMGKKKRH